MQLTEFIIIHILSICCLLDVSSTRSPPTATILPKIFFDPDKDSNDIFGLMSNDDMRGVAAILAKRTSRERMEIKISYSQLYGRNLKEDVAGKTKDEFHRLLKALLSPVPDYLIEEINWSLDQGKNWEYMSIICTSPGDLLKEMVYKYNNSEC
ncbi:hypothetical protein LSTR_LSTR014756 [Laodelphax striatellus]|uniref:Annexin n=1 Tax=Laodelphax striatellus TaxID=195883 RepID=A0A482XLX8_LAOST|nr:hypothetical protein LSTR_LSTR014756 [Laodelphax striatellus]